MPAMANMNMISTLRPTRIRNAVFAGAPHIGA
jgi:hypothetical protein